MYDRKCKYCGGEYDEYDSEDRPITRCPGCGGTEWIHPVWVPPPTPLVPPPAPRPDPPKLTPLPAAEPEPEHWIERMVWFLLEYLGGILTLIIIGGVVGVTIYALKTMP